MDDLPRADVIAIADRQSALGVARISNAGCNNYAIVSSDAIVTSHSENCSHPTYFSTTSGGRTWVLLLRSGLTQRAVLVERVPMLARLNVCEPQVSKAF